MEIPTPNIVTPIEPVLPCVAEWIENAKCVDWKKDKFNCCCGPPTPPEIRPELVEAFIELNFKFAINLDSLAPNSNSGANAARYKLKEITDEEAYEGGLIPKVHDEDKEGTEMEQSMDAYYQGKSNFKCGSWEHDPERDAEYSTWEDKKDGYGDVYLICKGLWWDVRNDSGLPSRELPYGYCENDACWTRLGKAKIENLHGRYHGSKDFVDRHGEMIVPACYGLPDFKDEPEFATPEWQREAPNTHCMPPLPNEYGEDGELTNTYQIFWRAGGSANYSSYGAAAIKAGEGDYPGDENVPVEHAIFWNALPNEEYEMIIRHDLYNFPNFYRNDNGDPLGFTPLAGEAHEDVRDHFFETINDPIMSNSPIDGEPPYIAGCECSSKGDGDTINDDPHAEINLNYRAGMSQRRTKKINFNSAKLANLAFCAEHEYIKTIEFDNIRPTTIFAQNGKSEEDYLKMSANGDENELGWIDYIKEGQYCVFHVQLAQTVIEGHPPGTTTSCHDQVSYHFAFAVNLKDVLDSQKRTDELMSSDPKFYTGAEAPLARAIKLHFPAQGGAISSSAELEYPGELHIDPSCIEEARINGKPQKQCIWLAGIPGTPHGKHSDTIIDSQCLQLPRTPSGVEYGHRGIREGILGAHSSFGTSFFNAGLTLLAELLAVKKLDSGLREEVGLRHGPVVLLEKVENPHAYMNEIYYHNEVADPNIRGVWSYFGPTNPTQPNLE